MIFTRISYVEKMYNNKLNDDVNSKVIGLESRNVDPRRCRSPLW